MNVGALLLAGLFIVYALFSRSLSRSSVTGPMLFAGAGLLVGVDLLGSGVSVEAFRVEVNSHVIQLLLEGTLAIILFSDAVMIDYKAVRKEASLPGRLLGIGLPLTIALGTVVALLLFPDLGFWGAAVIAIILAPTDAALGQAVVSNEDVPDMVRQGLGVESGLNDGIAVPFLAIAVAGAANEMQSAGEIATVFIEEIGLAIVIGLAVGLAGAFLVKKASGFGWTGREGRQVLIVFLAILSFALADGVGGSGFIAAFVGGLAFGSKVRREYPDICHFSEGTAHLLAMLSFFVFGALILGPVVELIEWRTVVYAILSLTIVRMIPVALALLRTGLRWPTVGFIGWFGPRGLASLVFIGTIVLDTAPGDSRDIVAVGATTVGLSILLHGVTAWPGSRRYAEWIRRTDEAMDEGRMTENDDVGEMPPMPQRGDLKNPMA
ncbi:MAG: cation:proton antiporter [Acidimicrobiia bacterium]